MIDKFISMKEKRIINMRLLKIILIVLFTTLIIPAVQAIQFNATPTQIKSTTAGNITDAQLLKYGDYWYLLYAIEDNARSSSCPTWERYLISKMDSDWTEVDSQDLGEYELFYDTYELGSRFCRMRFVSDEIRVYCDGAICGTGSSYAERYFYIVLNTTLDLVTFTDDITENELYNYPCVSNEGYTKSDGERNVWSVGRNNASVSDFFVRINGTFTNIDDPTDTTQYFEWDCQQDLHNLATSKYRVIYSGNVNLGAYAGNYYLFANVYDRSLDFEERISIMTDEQVVVGYTSNYGSYFDVYWDSPIYNIFWLNTTVDTQIRHLITDENFVEIDRIWIEDNVGTLNISSDFTDVRSIQLDIDPTGLWNLLVVGTSGYPTNTSVYLYEEYGACSCSAWVNSTCKEGTSYRTQVRSCVPDECDDEINYVYDQDCFEYRIPGIYPQKNKTVTDCTICNSEWTDPLIDASARCDIAMELPNNLTNIKTNSTLKVELERMSWIISPIGANKYQAIICNPLDNCYGEDVDWFCIDQWNLTLDWDYDSYNAGDLAQAGFIITDASKCAGEGWGLAHYGWWNYRVKGTLCYSGNILCGGRNVCTKMGLLWYSVPELSDCQLNMTAREQCTTNECDQDTGLCTEEITTERAGEIRSPSGNPFNWIIGEAEFNFGSTVLMGFSLFISVGVGGYAYRGTKSNTFGIIGFITMILFFATIRWIPIWIGVIITIGTVLFLSKELWLKK